MQKNYGTRLKLAKNCLQTYICFANFAIFEESIQRKAKICSRWKYFQKTLCSRSKLEAGEKKKRNRTICFFFTPGQRNSGYDRIFLLGGLGIKSKNAILKHKMSFELKLFTKNPEMGLQKEKKRYFWVTGTKKKISSKKIMFQSHTKLLAESCDAKFSLLLNIL